MLYYNCDEATNNKHKQTDRQGWVVSTTA